MPSINVYDSVAIVESVTALAGDLPISVNETPSVVEYVNIQRFYPASVNDVVSVAESCTISVVDHFYVDPRDAYLPTSPVGELSAEFGVRMGLAETGPSAELVGYFGFNMEGLGPSAGGLATLEAQYADVFTLAKPSPVASLSGSMGWALHSEAPTPTVVATLYSNSLNLSRRSPFPEISSSGLFGSDLTLASTSPTGKASGTMSETFYSEVDGISPVGYGLASLVGGNSLEVAATAPTGYVEYGNSTLDYDGMNLAKTSPVGIMGEALAGTALIESALAESGRFDDFILEYSRW